MYVIVDGRLREMAESTKLRFSSKQRNGSRQEILEISNRIRHPDDMIRQHANDLAKARERLPQFSQLNPDVQLPDFIQAALG